MRRIPRRPRVSTTTCSITSSPKINQYVAADSRSSSSLRNVRTACGIVSKQERKAPVRARIVTITGVTSFAHTGHSSAAAAVHITLRLSLDASQSDDFTLGLVPSTGKSRLDNKVPFATSTENEQSTAAHAVTLVATPDTQVAPLSGLYETLNSFPLLGGIEEDATAAAVTVSRRGVRAGLPG